MQSDPVTGLLRILEAPSHSEERPESCPLFPGRCDLPLSFPPRSTPLAPLLQPLCPPGCFLSPPGLVGLRAFTLTALPRIFYLQYSNVLPLHFLQVAAQAAESLAPPGCPSVLLLRTHHCPAWDVFTCWPESPSSQGFSTWAFTDVQG